MYSISFVGGYDENYPRNNVIIEGCQAHNIALSHIKIKQTSPFKRKLLLRKVLRKRKIETDFVLVPAFCHHEVSVVKKYTDRPIIFDPLISRYLTKIHDYKSAHILSIHALINFLVDKRSLEQSDYIFADTIAHKEYFCRKYKINSDKVYPLYIGYNSNHFFPVDHKREDIIKIGFYGGFNPLQGVDKIIAAADILRNHKNIRFELVGDGYTYEKVTEKAKSLSLPNVSFLGRKDYYELNRYIGNWDICLGIFGNTLKSDLVIPNKVFHYAGCRKPIITKNSPAIKEIFKDNESIFLIDPAPQSLANKILDLVDNYSICESAAQKGYNLILSKYSHIQIGENIKILLKKWK